MTSRSRQKEEIRPAALPTAAPAWTVVAAVAIVAAASIAAGSVGLLADPLRRVLMWVALLVALGAGAPPAGAGRRGRLVLAAAVLLALVMTAARQPEVHILAVALLGAALGWIHADVPRRVLMLAAQAVAVLAVVRIAMGAVSWLWVAADALMGALGQFAGMLAGEPLDVGVTYGGFDYLVIAAVIYGGWLYGTPAPRLRRGLIVAAVFVAGHVAYLVLLAHAESLRALLPDMVVPTENDRDALGVWTWGNAAHRLLPWNVPLLAMLIYGVILAFMLRWTAWLPDGNAEERPAGKEHGQRWRLPGGEARPVDWVRSFGPAALALLLPLLGWLAPGTSDLNGKTLVAYEASASGWLRPVHGEMEVPADESFGMLPVLVKSLGAAFVRSADLAPSDLADADAVLLLHPDRPWQPEQLDRLWDYVRGGGSLLVAGDPRVAQRGAASSFDEALRPTAITVRDDTVVGHQPNWQDGLQRFSHPTVTGVDGGANGFGFRYASSLRLGWSARPMVAGRYGYGIPGADAAITSIHRYTSGDRLGDLVLAAQQRLGSGRVVVLGGTSPLANQTLVGSYEFTGRLLGYLASRGSSPQAGWRQLMTLLAAAGLIFLLLWQPAPEQVGLSAVILAIMLASMAAASGWSSRVLPDGRAHKPRNNIAYVTATHAEFYGREPFSANGLAAFYRTLMRNDYLPLSMFDFTEARLERAGMLIAIAPVRPYSAAEVAMVRQFVQRGGHFICMIGAEQSRPNQPLLEAFGFQVPPSPVYPNETLAEPIPFGAFRQFYYREGNASAFAQFLSGWPVECESSSAQALVTWTRRDLEGDVAVSLRVGSGSVTVIGDSYIALNTNYESLASPAENDHFWHWLFARLAGPEPWTPPVAEITDDDAEEDAAGADAANEGAVQEAPGEEDARVENGPDAMHEDLLPETPLMEEAPLAEPEMPAPDQSEPDLAEPGMLEPDTGLQEPKSDEDGASEEDAEPNAMKIPDRFPQVPSPDSEPLPSP